MILSKETTFPALKNKPTVLISEIASDDFPRLPVIQDPNLLVVINRYADESQYQLPSQLCQESKNRMQQFIANEGKLILHPTVKSSVENAHGVLEHR